MPRYSFPNTSGTIQPTKPRTATYLNNSNPTANVYYTALDVSGGSGNLTRVSATCVTGTDNATLKVKITVDGNILEDTTFASGNGNSSYGLGGSDRGKFKDCIFNISFKSSLKVEVGTTESGKNGLSCVVNYGLD